MRERMSVTATKTMRKGAHLALPASPVGEIPD